MSGDPKQEYFADSMTEDLVTDLSKVSGLHVIDRNTVFARKGIAIPVQQGARDLGVRSVLEGSIRTAGSRVRISVHLVDGRTGEHMWAERYDRNLSDIFAIQDEIT
jgi:adenylate cyclase